MEQWTPGLGHVIPDDERRRDAIHVAVAPVTAAERLWPAQFIGPVDESDMELVGPVRPNRGEAKAVATGIVDPFLIRPVEKGERFWMMMLPNTITGLRHAWTHPAFERAAALRRTQAAQGTQGVTDGKS